MTAPIPPDERATVLADVEECVNRGIALRAALTLRLVATLRALEANVHKGEQDLARLTVNAGARLKEATARAEAAEKERDEMREALSVAVNTMRSSRVFVTSRERIRQPEGESWYDERVDRAARLLPGETGRG